MKKCPKCNDFALYDDNVRTCPICDTELVTYIRGGTTNGTSSGTSRTHNGNTAETFAEQPIRPNNRTQDTRSNNGHSSVPSFETKSGLRYHYRGTITEIHSNARLNSRLKKWVNALFRFEPYQFGHTSHETIIRVEGFHAGRVSGQRRDLIFYGDVEGRFNYGDDVSITAKRHGDRYIVTNMYLNETQSYVKPRPQIPAGVIALLTLGLLILALFLVVGIVSFITSGALFALFDKLVVILIIVAVAWWFIRSIFRRR